MNLLNRPINSTIKLNSGDGYCHIEPKMGGESICL